MVTASDVIGASMSNYLSSHMSYVWLILAALAAGAMNSVAGGGTLLTFPTLRMALQGDSVLANGSSTIALFPGSLAGALGFRQEMRAVRRWLFLLAPPCVVGAVIGTLLVTRLDKRYFETMVPWLILVAATLYLLQPAIARWSGFGTEHRPPTSAAVIGIVVFQFLIAVYGGYFGAGIGILMISSLSLAGIGDIHKVNALKTLLAACINLISTITWIVEGKIAWPLVAPMIAASIVGGYLGAHYSRRLDRRLVRWLIIIIGFALAAWYFWKRYGGS